MAKIITEYKIRTKLFGQLHFRVYNTDDFPKIVKLAKSNISDKDFSIKTLSMLLIHPKLSEIKLGKLSDRVLKRLCREAIKANFFEINIASPDSDIKQKKRKKIRRNIYYEFREEFLIKFRLYEKRNNQIKKQFAGMIPNNIFGSHGIATDANKAFLNMKLHESEIDAAIDNATLIAQGDLAAAASIVTSNLHSIIDSVENSRAAYDIQHSYIAAMINAKSPSINYKNILDAATNASLAFSSIQGFSASASKAISDLTNQKGILDAAANAAVALNAQQSLASTINKMKLEHINSINNLRLSIEESNLLSNTLNNELFSEFSNTIYSTFEEYYSDAQLEPKEQNDAKELVKNAKSISWPKLTLTQKASIGALFSESVAAYLDITAAINEGSLDPQAASIMIFGLLLHLLVFIASCKEKN